MDHSIPALPIPPGNSVPSGIKELANQQMSRGWVQQAVQMSQSRVKK